MASDSASAMWRKYTSLPMKDTVLPLVFRHFAAEIVSKHIEEFWHRAQHTTQGTDWLARLNAEAHMAAQGALQRSWPYQVPCMGRLPATVWGFHHGNLIVRPTKVVDKLYHMVMVNKHYT